MDADVPTLAPLVYVGVNEEHNEGELDNAIVSVISVNLMAKLKKREDLRVEQIGMVNQEISKEISQEVEEEVEEWEEAAETNVPSEDLMVTTNVNPSLAGAETDEVELEQRCTQEMQANLEEMQGWRDQRSSSSALVLLPHSAAPTQSQPQNGADMAMGALMDTLPGGVLVATPIDGSDPYVVPAHHINKDTSVTYEFIETSKAVRRGIVDPPTLTSDPHLPLARAPGSNRAGKRPVNNTDGPKTYEQRLAEALDITAPTSVTIPEKPNMEYTEEMQFKRDDTKEVRKKKEVMQKRKRAEVSDLRRDVDCKKNLKRMSEETMKSLFHNDWEDYFRRNGVKPPLEAVIYWVIYYPFLKDVLSRPPYAYRFDESAIQQVVDKAKLVKISNTGRMDAENSIKSILASAILKTKNLQEEGITTETDLDVLETLKSIIAVYTKGQKELLESMQASSGKYTRGLLQSNDAKQTKKGLDDAPLVEILERLNETLAMGTAGTSQAGFNNHIVKVFDNGIGAKNPHIERLNELYERYWSNTVTAKEKKSIEKDYETEYNRKRSWDHSVQDAQDIYRRLVAESSATYNDTKLKILQVQELLNQKRVESDELKAEDDKQAEQEDNVEFELAQIVRDWNGTPDDVKQQIFPPDGKIPEGDTSAQRQERMEVLLERLQAKKERRRRITALMTEMLALQCQVTQYVFAARNSESVMKATQNKLRYQGALRRVEQTEESKKRRAELNVERRKKNKTLEDETGGDVVAMALANLANKAEESRVSIDKELPEAKAVIERLKSAKEAFESEKKAKIIEHDNLNRAYKERRKDLSRQIALAKEKLGKGGKAVVVEKVWDAAAQNIPLNQKYKEWQDALKTLKVEADRMKRELHDCTKEAVKKGTMKEKLLPLKELADQYKIVLANSEGQVSQASVSIATNIKELLPALVIRDDDDQLRVKPGKVEHISQKYSTLKDEFTAMSEKCLELEDKLNAKEKEIADRKLEFTHFTGHILKEFYQESLSSDGAPPGPPTDEEKANAVELVELMVEDRELELKIDKYNRVFVSDYYIGKSAEKLNKSSSGVARAYGELTIELRKVRGRIETALNNLAMHEVIDDAYLQSVVSVFNEAKRNDLYQYIKAQSIAVDTTRLSREGMTLKENLALRITQSKRRTPRAIKSIEEIDAQIGEDLRDAVTAKGFTEDSETKMRLAEYQDAVDDIVRFAKAGSGRALHYYSLLCYYASHLSALSPEGADKSSLFVSFDESIEACELPQSKARNLTIYWENVERYKPPVDGRNWGAQLIHVIVQWTRLPMERRAGSTPSLKQLQEWIDGRLISDGADGSPPQIDEISSELMVVTKEDKSYNAARGIHYDVSKKVYEYPDSAGGDQKSEPLGPIKRTPVSWVTIKRGRAMGIHVPITDEFSICRVRPSPPFVRQWALHLTELEAVGEYVAADKGSQKGKENRARAAFKTATKWKRSPSDEGKYTYDEFDPSDFSPAFWTAVETSRDNHARLVDDYKSSVDHISQLEQKLDELANMADNADGASMSIKTVASLAQEAGVLVSDSVRNADVIEGSMINLSTMPGTSSDIITVYNHLKTFELARDRLGYRMAADFGIPKTGYKNLNGNTMQVFQDTLDSRTKYQSSVERSSVLDRAPMPPNEPAQDGMNATAEKRMWLDNRQMVESAVMLFNQFLQRYYPWETPLSADDEGRILRFLEWMRNLRRFNFTHVVLLMKSDTDMRMWVSGFSGGGASQRVLGPGFTSSTDGFRRKDSEEDLEKQSRWYTYAESWYQNTASRVERWETSVVNLYGDHKEEVGDNKFMTHLAALVKESAGQEEREKIIQSANRAQSKSASSGEGTSDSGAYQRLPTNHRQVARLEYLNARRANLDESEDGRHLFDAMNGQLRFTNQNGTLSSNPLITVSIEGDGAVAAQNMTVKLLEIEPQYMRAVIKALRRDFPGKYSTCLRFVAVNGSEKTIGNIVLNQFVPNDFVYGTFYKLEPYSNDIGKEEFVRWLDTELKNTQELEALQERERLDFHEMCAEAIRVAECQQQGVPVISDDDHDSDEDSDDDDASSGATHSEQAMDTTEQGLPVESDVESDDDSSGAKHLEQDMDTTEALADEQKAIEEAEFHMMVMRNTRVSDMDSNTLECTLCMYDPGFLKSPMAACGAPIRPMPLSDFELEVA